MKDRELRGDGLGRSASRGIWTTATGQLIAIATQLLSVVVLARLLSPEDYGLLAMVTAIVVIGEVIREFGLANAAIQAPDLTAQQRTNLFWWNTGLGAACTIALFLSAPVVAGFYSEPRVEPLAQVLSVTFVLNGLATQSKAHLARNMRFGALNISDVLPGIVGLIVAVIAALLGWGVWALVAQRIVIASSMLTLSMSFDRWLPGLPRRTIGMKPLLRYGLNLVGAQLISGASRNADYIVIGHRFGAEATGLYSRGFELVINTLNQINAPSTKVAVPILSRLQDDTDRYNRYLIRGQRALLFVIVPLLGIGAALAPALVDLALGSNWTAVVPYVQALAVVAAADKILGYATWWYALSKGRTDVSLKVTIVRSILLVAGVTLGSSFGPIGVAWGYAIGATIGWLVDLAMYRWLADAPSGTLFINAIVVVLMNAFPILVVFQLGGWLAGFGTVLHLVIGIGIYVAAWLAIAFAIPLFRSELKDILVVVRRLRGR